MDIKAYIIKLDEEPSFFTVVQERIVYASQFPSFATHLEYLVADEICRRLRDRGYPHSIVCDALGEPVTVAALKDAQPVSETKIREYWDDRLTQADWEQMRAVIAGKGRVEFAAELGITVAELASRMDDANKRFETVSSEIRKSTRGKADFLKANQIEHQERKINQSWRKK